MNTLNPTAIRLLGCLIEKEMTTPDYYPMTINGLTNAANQKSNRDPVMTLTEQDVLESLNGLRDLGAARTVRSPGGRAMKYKHALNDLLEIDPEQAALLAVLMLRGEQTPGELRARTERYHDFDDLATVEAVLTDLQTRREPLVARLSRRPGEKEARYRHLLGGDSQSSHVEVSPVNDAQRIPLVETDELGRLRERLDALERRVTALESE